MGATNASKYRVCLDSGMRRRRAVVAAGSARRPAPGCPASAATTIPCSRTSPCQTFAGALVKTAINGEINCLDPGGFGAVTITKSITIDCTGTMRRFWHIGGNGRDRQHPDERGRSASIGASARPRNRVAPATTARLERAPASTAFAFVSASLGVRRRHGDRRIHPERRQGGGDERDVNLTLDNVTIRNVNTNGVSMTTTKGQVVASFNNVRIDGTPVAIAALGLVRANVDNVMLVHNLDRHHDHRVGQHDQCRQYARSRMRRPA